MADTTTEIDLDSVIDRLLEGESSAQRLIRSCWFLEPFLTQPSPR